MLKNILFSPGAAATPTISASQRRSGQASALQARSSRDSRTKSHSAPLQVGKSQGSRASQESQASQGNQGSQGSQGSLESLGGLRSHLSQINARHLLK